MKKRIKRGMFLIAVFVVGTALIQIIRFTMEKHAWDGSVPEKEYGNCPGYLNERNIGNYVLVRKDNGITTFPFIFGMRLYLYDIEKERYHLIDHTIEPFTEIGNDIMAMGGKAYYNIPIWNEAVGSTYSCNYKGGQRVMVPDTMLCYLGYSVYKEQIYAWNWNDYDVENEAGKVYSMDCNTEKIKAVTEDDVTFFKVVGKTLYSHNYDTKMLKSIDLESGEEQILSDQCEEVSDIFAMEGEQVLLAISITDSDKVQVMRYSPENSSLTKESEIKLEHLQYSYKMEYRDGKIYYYGDVFSKSLCVYEVALKENGKEKTLINVLEEEPFLKGKEYEDTRYMEVSYCDDYIAIEIYYYADGKIGDHSKLLIYDYSGELLQKKILW